MRGCITGSTGTGAAGAPLSWITNTITARLTLAGMVCLLVVWLVVISGCLSGNSAGGPPALSQTDPPVATAAGAAPATPADTPLTGASTCRQGLSDCGGFCRDLTSDIGNCGACGKTCPSNSACKDSQCACKDGYSASLDGTCHPAGVATAVPGCDGHPGTKLCDTQCVYTDTDPGHCGSCTVRCPAGQNCVSGQCVSAGGAACNTGQTLCNGQCSDILTNPANCGACGHSCLSGQNCINGQCVATAQPCGNGLTNCNGQCVNTQTDINHCGSCNLACMTNIMGTATGEVCLNAQCTCPQGQVDCGVYSDAMHANVDKCTDVKTDALNCGTCGTHCTSSQTCNNGKCVAKLGNILQKSTFQVVTT